jgi:hypothetical protein
MHIPPTLFAFLTMDDFWQELYKARFLSLIEQHQSKIVMVLGAHIH